MNVRLIISMIALASATVYASPDAESLTEEKCATCHFSSFTPERLKNIVAPPLWALPKQAKRLAANQDECIDFIIDYTLHPSREKMRFPKEAYERFGLMPSQRDNVTDEEIKSIAGFLCR